MRMICASVDLELRKHLTTNLVLWKHATNRVTNDLFWLAVHAITNRFRSKTRVTGIPSVATLVALVTRVMDLFAISENDEIAIVIVRRVSRLVFAHQDRGDVRCNAADSLVFAIDNPPSLGGRIVSL